MRKLLDALCDVLHLPAVKGKGPMKTWLPDR